MSTTYTSTYSVSDVEIVMRRFHADLLMIAESSRTLSKTEVQQYVEDIATLAKAGYLAWVDVTLLSYGLEHRAVTYSINESASDLASSRPGDVIWPILESARLRLVIGYSKNWRELTQDQRTAFKKQLNIGWVPNSDDLNHLSLRAQGSRDYASNSFGLSRKDYGK